MGAILFLQLSCNHKKSAESSPGYLTEKSPDLFAKTQEMKVICHDEESCSPSVGNYVIYDVQKNPTTQRFLTNYGNCTASLIAPDTVILNRHCFIDDKIKAGDKCANIFIKFPKVKEHAEEIHQCAEVLFRPVLNFKNDDEKYQNMDVAILKLKTGSKRPVLKISTEGFQNNEMVSIHRFTTQEVQITKDKKELRSYLEVLHCPVVQDAALLPVMRLSSHPFSAFVYLANCPVVESNSGSPILDSRSYIKGVINIFVDAEKIKSLFSAAAKLKNGGRGINLACVDHPSVNPEGVKHPECVQTLDFEQQKIWSDKRKQELHVNRFELIKDSHSDFYQKARGKFTWAYAPAKEKGAEFLEFLKPHQKFWFVPKCVNTEQELKDFYSSIKILPVFLDESFFDEVGRVNEKISVEALKVKTVETKTNYPNASLKIYFDETTSSESFQQDIPLCGE